MKSIQQPHKTLRYLLDGCSKTVSLTTTELSAGFNKYDRTRYCSDLLLDCNIHDTKRFQTAVQLKGYYT